MGEIFLARLEGAAGFEKLCVIKRVLPHLADDPRFRTMLVDEAQIAAKMSHPNICQVYELGETNGELYIAMEYLEGMTLLSVLRRAAKAQAPLSLGLVAGILQHACDALHYAHELKDRDGTSLNIVHRDVTPSNLFLTETGIVKVLDFGIAKIKNASASTQAGTVKGKYAYMAPEQLRSGVLDRRVDVFALAIVGFEMLALRHLFQRKTDYLTFRAVMELPIPSLREFRPDAPPALAEVFTRALERDPSNRYASVRQFAAAVHDAVVGHAKPWTTSDISDYIRQSFAEELEARRSALASTVSRGPGRGTAPIMALGEKKVDDEDDFPSIGTGVHQLEHGSERVPTTGERGDAAHPITELSAAPKPGFERRTVDQTPTVPSAEPVGRGRLMWILPVVAILIVGAGAGGMYVMSRSLRSEPPVVIVRETDDAPVPSDAGTGAANMNIDAAEAVAQIDAGVTPMDGGGAAAPVRVACGRGAADEQDRLKKCVYEKATELGACNKHTADAKGLSEIIIKFKQGSGGKAQIKLTPDTLEGTPLGECIIRAGRSIYFGPQGVPAGSFSLSIAHR
jgi:serine/threonine-protein kinase